MGTDARDTLVLNASFEPLSTVTLRRAVVLVLQDKAVVEQAHPGLRIRAAGVELPVPQVIRLCRYVRVPFRNGRRGRRRGVLIRDRHRCAYCGRRATTVDHVVPRSHGGGDTWLNTVAACAPDNHRKADRTPEQAGMRLLAQPFEPTPADALLLALGQRDGGAPSGSRSPPDWLSGCRGRPVGRRPVRRGLPERSSSWMIAASPTSTMTARSAVGRQAAADPGADQAADRRAAGDQQDRRPVEVGDEEEEDRGDAVHDGAEDVLDGVEALQVVVEQQAHQGEVDDALGGTEVAAVGAGEPDAAEEQRPAVRGGPGGRPAPGGAGPRGRARAGGRSGPGPVR